MDAFGISPVLATPIPRCQLARRVAVTPMSSPKALPAPRDALLDGHLRVAVPDCLAFTPFAGSHHKLLRSTRSTPRAIAG